MSTDAPGGNSRSGYRLDWMISVDDHILEPPGIWQDRLPARYLEAGPQVMVKDGTEYWRYEGRLFPTSGLSAVAGKKHEDITLFMMHESCPVTGKIFNVGTGRVGEVFVGVTRGYVSPDGELAPEDVLDHFDEVRDVSESNVPIDIGAHGSWVRSVLADRANRAARDASELHKALLTAPAVVRSQRALRQSLTTALGARTVEVVILRHAAVTGNAYCWEHHLAPAKAVGLSEAEIAAIKAGNCEALDESEVQLVGFVDSCLAGRDTSALRDALSTALGEPAVLQLAMLIGYYSMIGIARAALGVKTGGT